MLEIDGSAGEGGGQILRSALSLSLLTQTPFRITGIRAGRSRPGLLRQHLLCVEAAAAIGDAQTLGAEMGATTLVFRPRAIRGGTHTFAIGGAGSTTLVFQTVLVPLLLRSSETSTLTFRGGTHNPMAPPLDFLEGTFLRLLARLLASTRGRVEIGFERHGFYPAGGGAWSASIAPCAASERLARLELLERGAIRSRRAVAIVSQVPSSVALRELAALAQALEWTEEERAASQPLTVRDGHGPGNALLAFIESDALTEVFCAFGERGVRAEQVAATLAKEVSRYLASDAPVGEHLADQLLLPLAMGSGGSFRTLTPSLHCRTQADILRAFLGVEVTMREDGSDGFRIDVPARS